MPMLTVLEVLHENPYTGDRITKARVVHHFDNGNQQVPIGTTVSRTSEQSRPAAAISTAIGDTEPNNSNATSEAAATKVSGLVAIKYLSDYKAVRPRHGKNTSTRCGWSSSEDETSDNSSEDGRDSPVPILPVAPPALTKQSEPLRVWPYIGHTTAPHGIKFGVKARREIRALKAAQGHPNIIPFLGFTGQPLDNPYKHTTEHEQVTTAVGPLINEQQHSQLEAAGVLDSDNHAKPLPSRALGGSLFQDDQKFAPPLFAPLSLQDANPLAPADTLESPPVFRYARSESSFGSDDDSSHDEAFQEDPDKWTPEAAARYWNRVFSRQPRIGGIILPYVPITVRDIIRIGWTRSRPRLVETCMRQILEGLAWMHDEVGLIHRDISSGNILVAVGPETSSAKPGIVQCMISDFGCATFYRSKTGSDQGATVRIDHATDREEDQSAHVGGEDDNRGYQKLGLTFEVGTRAYRAPELLFSSTSYTNTIDIWSAGVIFAEMYLGRTLFEADSDIGQICAIVKVLGTPSEENWPEYPSMPDSGKLLFKALEVTPLSSILRSDSGTEREPTSQDPDSSPKSGHASTAAIDLIEKMIVYSGAARLSAREALGFSNQYLERTMTLPGHTDKKVTVDESEDCNTGREEKQCDEYLDQCRIDVPRIIEEIQQLREREANEEEEYEGGRFGGFGGAHESQPYGGFSDVESEGEDAPWESGGEKNYRSDDLAGEDDLDETPVGKPGKWTGPALAHEPQDDVSGRAVKRRRNSADNEEGEEVAYA
ncbi:Cyclin-dependent kinase 20 [Mortierella alpina]|nr:Cyclin-dependent kinase 20 [Mortierella alpina]